MSAKNTSTSSRKLAGSAKSPALEPSEKKKPLASSSGRQGKPPGKGRHRGKKRAVSGQVQPAKQPSVGAVVAPSDTDFQTEEKNQKDLERGKKSGIFQFWGIDAEEASATYIRKKRTYEKLGSPERVVLPAAEKGGSYSFGVLLAIIVVFIRPVTKNFSAFFWSSCRSLGEIKRVCQHISYSADYDFSVVGLLEGIGQIHPFGLLAQLVLLGMSGEIWTSAFKSFGLMNRGGMSQEQKNRVNEIIHSRKMIAARRDEYRTAVSGIRLAYKNFMSTMSGLDAALVENDNPLREVTSALAGNLTEAERGAFHKKYMKRRAAATQEGKEIIPFQQVLTNARTRKAKLNVRNFADCVSSAPLPRGVQTGLQASTTAAQEAANAFQAAIAHYCAGGPVPEIVGPPSPRARRVEVPDDEDDDDLFRGYSSADE